MYENILRNVHSCVWNILLYNRNLIYIIIRPLDPNIWSRENRRLRVESRVTKNWVCEKTNYTSHANGVALLLHVSAHVLFESRVYSLRYQTFRETYYYY